MKGLVFGDQSSFQQSPDLWVTDGQAERAALCRADMTVYGYGGGGFVVSTSSVAWIGVLSRLGDDNDVGQIVRNLIAKFWP